MWTVAPMDEGTIWYLCTVAPLLYLLSDLLPPPPLPNVQYMQYTDSVWLWWGGGRGVEMYCGPYSAGVLHSVSDQIQNLQNCFTTPNKMTNEDDIKGLVSLKFLRPCCYLLSPISCLNWRVSPPNWKDCKLCFFNWSWANLQFLDQFDYIKVRQMILFTAAFFWVVQPAYDVSRLLNCGKLPFFNAKAIGLVLQTNSKWREVWVSLGSCKNLWALSQLMGLQVPFSYFSSSRNPFRNLFNYLFSKAAMYCQKNV